MIVAFALCFVWDTKLDFPTFFIYLFFLMFIFHFLYMFSVYVLDSQKLTCLLIMIVNDDEVIHY